MNHSSSAGALAIKENISYYTILNHFVIQSFHNSTRRKRFTYEHHSVNNTYVTT